MWNRKEKSDPDTSTGQWDPREALEEWSFSWEAVCQNVKIQSIYTIDWEVLTANTILEDRISD